MENNFQSTEEWQMFNEQNKVFDVASYWDNRYKSGGNSGAGSYNTEAVIKASVINAWIKEHEIRTITELGCGDGNNLQMYNVPISYCGYDLSQTAVEICNEKTRKIKNSLKYFFTSDMNQIDLQADLCLSLDVWYHLVDDKVFADYCNILFNGGWKYIIAYTTDTDSEFISTGEKQADHLKQRSFTNEYQKHPQWELVAMLHGYKTQDEKVMNFPGDKKFFLLKRV